MCVPSRRRAAFALVLLPGLLLAGCGERPGVAGQGGGPVTVVTDGPAPGCAAAAATGEVAIDNFTFNPAVLTVPAGTKVTWTNRDDVPHTVTSAARRGPLASPALDTGESFAHVFTAPGTYEYYCAVHPKMTGRVVVK